MADRLPTDGSPIPFRAAVLTWLTAWMVGMLLVSPLVLAGVGADGDNYTIPELGVATMAGWSVLIAGLLYTGRRYAGVTTDPVSDLASTYAVRWRPVDLAGIPLGVFVQLVAVPLLYVPLREIWPSTFSTDEIEERAQELADKAGGVNSLLLIVIVAVGAPLVEELVYRGLLQRSMARAVGPWPALAFTAAWFALVHPVPIEYPGLFVAGLAFGVWVAATGRLGGAVLTHFAFNLTGVIFALR